MGWSIHVYWSGNFIFDHFYHIFADAAVKRASNNKTSKPKSEYEGT